MYIVFVLYKQYDHNERTQASIEYVNLDNCIEIFRNSFKWLVRLCVRARFPL